VAAEGFEIKVVPHAGREEIDGERDGCVLVHVRAAAEKGRANDAVRRLIAAKVGVRPGEVELLRGKRSRRKTVRVASLTAAEARQRMLAED
jgi:uncharacterized protein YggU (UPF0235/DUF167 family)